MSDRQVALAHYRAWKAAKPDNIFYRLLFYFVMSFAEIMCKYRYEYFSYCGHQAFYLFDFCDKATISTKATSKSLSTVYNRYSEEHYNHKQHNTRSNGEEGDSPNTPSEPPFTDFSAPPHQSSVGIFAMSSKTSGGLNSPQIVRGDSAKFLETCYKALEQSTVDETRHQPSMEGSPGYRSISRHAFEERLRFFETAITSSGTDISDTLSKFTFDSKTDTLYSLDQQLKRILEKAQLLKNVSQEKSAGTLKRLPNGISRSNTTARLEKNNEEKGRSLHTVLSCSDAEMVDDAAFTKKATRKLGNPEISKAYYGEKNVDIAHDIGHGVIKSPKALEAKNVRKSLPSQWISHKINSDHRNHESIRTEPNTPHRCDQNQRLQNTSRRSATKASASPQTKTSLSCLKTNGNHIPSSPISCKAPNLKTAERAAARGLKRGQIEMTSGSSLRIGRNVTFSQDRCLKNPTSSLRTKGTSSSEFPTTPLGHSSEEKEEKSNCLSDGRNSESKFTFSPLLVPKPLFHAEHHRNKSSNTSTSSVNQTFYSAPQSPSKQQPMNYNEASAGSTGAPFNYSENDEAVPSSILHQKELPDRSIRFGENDKVGDTQTLRENHSSPRKRPRLRLQTSFVDLQATTADTLSSALPESSSGSSIISPCIFSAERERLRILNNKLMQSAAKLSKEQIAQRMMPVQEAEEISSCTAEPSSSITVESQESWQSCFVARNRKHTEEMEHADLTSDESGEKGSSYIEEGQSLKHSFALAATDSEDSGNLAADEKSADSMTMAHSVQKKSGLSDESESSSCKERDDGIFIDPSTIVQPQSAEREVEEKIVVEIQETGDPESDSQCLKVDKADGLTEDVAGSLDEQQRQKSTKKAEVGTAACDTRPGYSGVTFSSRLKATAPNFVPQTVTESFGDKYQQQREQYDEFVHEDEPFAHQMDLLSAQLQHQVMSTDYMPFNPFFFGVPQVQASPFQIPFVNAVHSMPTEDNNKRPWHKHYKGKKKYNKKADRGERTPDHYSPVASMGAFRDDEDSPLGFSSDSTVIEQRSGGVDGGFGGASDGGKRGADNPDERSGGDGLSNSMSFSPSSSSSATEVETCDDKIRVDADAADTAAAAAAAAAGRQCDHFVSVKPCDEIVVEKAVEYVGGLPCRECYSDFPASA